MVLMLILKDLQDDTPGRPPGPEPHSRAYLILLKPSVPKRLILNLLRAARYAANLAINKAWLWEYLAAPIERIFETHYQSLSQVFRKLERRFSGQVWCGKPDLLSPL